MKKRSLIISALLMVSAVITATHAELSVQNISEENKVSLTLDMAEKRFAVTGGCNTMMGGLEINEFDEFEASRNLASTLMACSEPLELMNQRINSFLENKPKVVRQGQKLFLVGTVEGETNSVFMPVVLDKGQYKDVAAETYERIFIYVSNEQINCPSNPDEKCLQIRTEKTDAWKPYEGAIEGFSPENNIKYRLRLKEYDKGTEKQRWVYDMAVEQEIVQ